jgi:DNA-binding NtrC family response regulator
MKPQGVLIAYQDDPWVEAFMAFFHGEGYRITRTASVGELIKKVRSGDFHVILLDEDLEGVKACELVPLLKKINGRVQVIVMSSEGSLPCVRQLRRTGIFYHALKPVDMGELRSAVGCAFEKIEREHPVAEGFFPFWLAGRVSA